MQNVFADPFGIEVAVLQCISCNRDKCIVEVAYLKKKAYDVIQASEAHHSESFDMRYAARVSEGSVLSRILKRTYEQTEL